MAADKLNWGVKIRDEGKTPRGRMSAEEANDLQAKFNANADLLDAKASSDYVNEQIGNTVEYVNQGDEQNASAISNLSTATLPTPSDETFIIL